MKQDHKRQIDASMIIHQKNEQQKAIAVIIAEKKTQLKTADNIAMGYHEMLQEISREVADANFVPGMAEWNFGVLGMGDEDDTLKGHMEEIAGDSKLMFDEDFHLKILSKLQEKIDPFDEYQMYMLEEK